MKVLFVCSGNNRYGISPIVRSQGDSLVKQGLEVDYYPITGKGLAGYLKNILPLRKHLQSNRYDIVHSHYSLSSFVASLAGARNQVVSLMGSDIRLGFTARLLVRFFNRFRWKACLVKSEDMRRVSGLKKAPVIPNGVDLETFKPMDQNTACQKAGLDPAVTHAGFVADPSREEKNFSLAREALDRLGAGNVNLQVIRGMDHDRIPLFLNACSIVILTSRYEGSPNVIKEAMACNRPIVSTDVGDVKWVTGDTEGCYLTGFDAKETAQKITRALEFAREKGRTTGRDRIVGLGLDSDSIAKRVIQIYQGIL